MNDKLKSFLKIASLSIALAILVGGLWFWSSFNQTGTTSLTADSGIILFFGQECPHCKDLEKWIKDERVSEKVSFDSLEVWHSASNREIFSAKASECGFSEDQLGVPFLFAKGECYVGTPEIEKFFRQEAGLE